MIPLMTRRSSTLGLPRVSLGRCGLSRANCSSLSQKESRSITGLPSETLNHNASRFGNQFMGPEPSTTSLLAGLASTVVRFYTMELIHVDYGDRSRLEGHPGH